MYKEVSVFINSAKLCVTYRVGKNSAGNFEILDMAEDTDIWFHVGGQQSSCHVIACIPEKMDKKNIRDIVTQGAVICKSNSRFSSFKNVDIIYTYVSNVEKTLVEGTVIARETKIKNI
jgi:predicted ribosome quality control (RQC) complex YloA/Tae2 family protein